MATVRGRLTVVNLYLEVNAAFQVFYYLLESVHDLGYKFLTAQLRIQEKDK